MIRIPSDSGQLLRRHTTSSQHATHTGEAAALPPTPPPPTVDVAVDLSQCRYEIVRTVATVDLGWHVARDAENHDGAASRDDAASSSTSSGAGRLPLVIWSDLSVTPTRLVALRHGVAKSQWVSCVIVNHISGMGELCRKRPMAQNLGLMQASFPSAFRFVPAAWDGYDEYCKWALTQPAATDGGGVPCISKPSSGCMGRGIIVAPRAHPKLWQNGECVVQRYIDNPLLVDGRKFDLRCYVFVASVDPWRVYFANHGLMRLCAQPFERPSASNASVASVHLSNYAVNKTYVGSPVKSTPRPDEHDATLRTRLVSVSTSCGDSGVGVKQSFRYTTAMLLACCEEDEYVARGTFPPFDHAAATRALLESPDRYCCGYHERIGALLHQRRCIMAEVGADVRAEVTQRATLRVEAVWERIRLVALKALWSVLPKVEEAAASVTVRTQGRGASDVRCFELLGYNIMLDNDLQPWLIEVNHSPSWTVSSEEDGTIKRIVLRSVMQALAAERHRGPSSVKSTVKKPRRAGASEPSLRSPLTAVSPAVRPSSFTDSPMSFFGAPSPSDSLPPPLPPLSGSESGSFHGGSGSVSRARRSRMMLTMPGPEYHALLAACEAEALGDDFVRVYPPPDWTGVEMQPGLADPVAESPFERRRRLDIAKRKEEEVSETSTTDAARAAHHQPPTTWRASLRDEWVEAMEVFRLQREASRLRRGVS